MLISLVKDFDMGLIDRSSRVRSQDIKIFPSPQSPVPSPQSPVTSPQSHHHRFPHFYRFTT
ncbi:MAG: hypothetical protein ACKO2Z_10285 [Sphaerospermopsis kisseleviana]